jgi:hypothetical protein
MLKLNKKAMVLTLAGAVTLGVTTASASNFGVGVQDHKWQLIGVPGYHQNQTSTTTGGAAATASQCDSTDYLACMDFSGTTTAAGVLQDFALIDILEASNPNRITWDSNSSPGNKDVGGDYNGYVPGSGNKLFTDNGTSSGDSVVSLENNGSTYGLQYHSIVGLQVMTSTAGTLKKAAIVFDYNNTKNYKDYSSAMKTMYIKSQYAGGTTAAPDLKVIYQATMEGQSFKVQFSESTTVDPTTSTSPFEYNANSRKDFIYQGTFGDVYTYDDASTTSNGGLVQVQDPSASSSSTSYAYTDFKTIKQIFDMNLSNNAGGYMDPTVAGAGVEMLEGNLTVYGYDNTDTVDSWKAAWYYRTSQSQVVTDPNSEFSDFEAGKGYWVKFDSHNAALNAPDYTGTKKSIPGFLVGNAVSGNTAQSDVYTSSIIQPGWNLLSFDNGTLRYSTTGLGVKTGTAFNVITSGGAQKITVGAGTALVQCATFNGAIEAINDSNTTGVASGINKLNLRCYPAVSATEDGANGSTTDYALIIGDDTFTVEMLIAAYTNQNVVMTMAGSGYSAVDANVSYVNSLPAVNETNPTHYWFNSRFGEYALAVDLPQDSGTASGALTKYKMKLSLPTFETTAGSVATVSWDVFGTITDPAQKGGWLNDAQNQLDAIEASASNNVYGTDLNTSGAPTLHAWLISASGTYTGADANETLLVAMNKRFYLRDNTFIRTFDSYTDFINNDTTTNVKVVGGGKSDTQTVPVLHFNSKNVLDCATLLAGAALANTGVQAICPMAAAETNSTLMFVSNDTVNYDAQEVLDTNDTFKDITAAAAFAKDANDTVYGAGIAVYTASKLTTAATNGGSLYATPTAYRTNLTYAPIWAEDFPNNGPLYYITSIANGNPNYRPEIFLTAITAGSSTAASVSSSEISWKAVDVTRDPKEWFNEANNFDLFKTDAGKGYWVYVTDEFDPTLATDVVDGSEAYSLTGYHHFNNKFQQGYATTFNHADGELSAQVAGLFRSGTNYGYYTSGGSANVVATIGGTPVAMLTDTAVGTGSTTFSTPLNSFETPSFTESSAAITGVVSAVDGVGGRDTGATLSLPFTKPSQPVLTSNGSSISIASANAASVYVFKDNIDDTDYTNQLLFEGTAVDDGTGTGVATWDTATDTNFLSKFPFPTALAPEDAPVSPDVWYSALTSAQQAATSDVRFVAATNESQYVGTTTPVFLSDQIQYAFAPVYAQTEVLSATGLDVEDQDPYSFASATQLTGNKGVTLKSIVSNGGVTISYPPSQAATSETATLNTITIGSSATDSFALLRYSGSYVGKYFFVNRTTSAGSTMYWGIFPQTSMTTSGTVFVLKEISGSQQTIVKP